MTELLAEAAGKAAFKTALPLDALGDLHIPFPDLGFEAQPEAALAAAIGQQSGLSLVVGAPGNGKSSLLSFVAKSLAGAPAGAERLYLPLFVPVAPRGADAADVKAFAAMAIGSLLATFEDLTRDEEQALARMTAEQVTREAPSYTLNAKLAANVFGAGVEGGIESKEEVVTITSSGGALDEYGGLPTLAHTLRGRGRELVVIVEDTDGWTIQSHSDQGSALAGRFFAAVLAPLATLEISVVVAVQTRWTQLSEFAYLHERAVRRIVLPTFESRDLAEATVRRVVARRLEWALGTAHDAPDAITDAAARMLAAKLAETGSIRTVLTLLRDALDQFDGRYPERIDAEHLIETA